MSFDFCLPSTLLKQQRILCLFVFCTCSFHHPLHLHVFRVYSCMFSHFLVSSYSQLKGRIVSCIPPNRQAATKHKIQHATELAGTEKTQETRASSPLGKNVSTVSLCIQQDTGSFQHPLHIHVVRVVLTCLLCFLVSSDSQVKGRIVSCIPPNWQSMSKHKIQLQHHRWSTKVQQKCKYALSVHPAIVPARFNTPETYMSFEFSSIFLPGTESAAPNETQETTVTSPVGEEGSKSVSAVSLRIEQETCSFHNPLYLRFFRDLFETTVTSPAVEKKKIK